MDRKPLNVPEGPTRTQRESALTRETVLHLLARHREELHRRFRVKSLALFGSVARGEAGPQSDVDILVEFEGPATFDGNMELKFYLEDPLGCPVDLVTVRALKARIRALCRTGGHLCPVTHVFEGKARRQKWRNPYTQVLQGSP